MLASLAGSPRHTPARDGGPGPFSAQLPAQGYLLLSAFRAQIVGTQKTMRIGEWEEEG